MSDLQTLKKRRASIKSGLTRFKNFLSNYSNDDYNELKVRVNKFDALLGEYDVIQTEIEILDEVSELTEHSRERDLFEKDFYKLSAQAQSILGNETNGAFVPNPQNNFVNSNCNSIGSNVKLPPINLPTFDGSYDKWLHFFDAFTAIIHNNRSLTGTQKFYYLQSSVTGDAKKAIQSLQISDDNYQIAWELLCKRFQHKRAIVKTHINAILKLKEINKECKDGLRKLVDDLEKNMRALDSLGLPTSSWDTIIIEIIVSKLDNVTKRDWEQSIQGNELPNYADFISFLGNKCYLLESLQGCKSSAEIKVDNKCFAKVNKRTETFSHLSTQQESNKKPMCNFCKNSTHFLASCREFLKLKPVDRDVEVRKMKLCTNCLRTGHFVRDCTSFGCKLCNHRHNTLLHFDRRKEAENSEQKLPESIDSADASVSNLTIAHSVESFNKTHVFLSTALVEIYDVNNRPIRCRALLDSGSQGNFLTKNLCNKLGISTKRVDVPVAGLNGAAFSIQGCTRALIGSRFNGFRRSLDFLVIDKITGKIPVISFACNKFNIPENIRLADPQFCKAAEVDVLLGAGVFFDLLCVGQFSLGRGLPTAQKTQLGWVISGPFAPSSGDKVSLGCHLSVMQDLHNKIEQFWEVEEFDHSKIYSREEQECEAHFVKNTVRDDAGRFTVKLPVRENLERLGESKESARKRFYALERKLASNDDLRTEYCKFMSEYQALGHMSITDETREEINVEYFLPHHCVIKETSITTKLRVVFDGSSKSSSGLSLNDVLKVGPVIQQDLFDIITRFRQHNVVLLADIEKMYRQVQVHESQRHLQQIFWREGPQQKLQIYQLNTLTYGTGPASFLAVRCIHQLADDNRENCPIAAEVIRRDFYVDDFISGTDTSEGAILLKNEVSKILSAGGFNLRKWITNDRVVRQTFVEEEQGNTPNHYVISNDNEVKTLGVVWNAELDLLTYTVNMNKRPNDRVTKRLVLSLVSQIFDPLGLLGPIIIRAKVLIQELWKLKLGWDESLPIQILTTWNHLKQDFSLLNAIKIPRKVLQANPIDIQIHGFSDASEVAYGAALYIRSVDKDGNILVRLLCAKSRVAPLKTISLPRLELCGALLCAKLGKKAIASMNLNISKFFCWTDSTIVLSWLASEPSNLKCFVGNRVGKILRLTNVLQWGHVRSNLNPADIISRGTSTSVLLDSNLWWYGPEFIWKSVVEIPPQIEFDLSDIPERRKVVSLPVSHTIDIFDLFSKFSALTKLIRVTAYCLRFLNNARKGCKLNGRLSNGELSKAFDTLIKLAQHASFADDIRVLNSKGSVEHSSKLLSLNPFIDPNGFIRVGGRIRNASFSCDRKHQLLLSDKHPLTRLIIEAEHIRNLHSAAQLTLSIIRCKFWILNAKNAIKTVLHKCVVCFKARPRSMAYQMGDLPEYRLAPTRPFYNCGVDFAGPLFVKDGRTRNSKIVKSYMCVFICLSTKAIHLELAGDLSTESFLNALKRLIARRGVCKNIYSDNGTNFLGASKELKRLFSNINGSDNCVINYLQLHNMEWHFIPPRAPNFGGIWEAAVKSAKYHLKRILSDAHLTYEQMYTVLVQVEAVLNSRPLCELTNDPNDFLALTPSHFLIGDVISSIPEADVTQFKINRLSQYARLRQMVQHFWRRWQKEYLNSLQQRNKWKKNAGEALTPGVLVLVRDEDNPPLDWRLGRVSKVFPGADGIVRVAEVNTNRGVLKRPTTKLCLLPINE